MQCVPQAWHLPQDFGQRPVSVRWMSAPDIHPTAPPMIIECTLTLVKLRVCKFNTIISNSRNQENNISLAKSVLRLIKWVEPMRLPLHSMWIPSTSCWFRWRVQADGTGVPMSFISMRRARLTHDTWLASPTLIVASVYSSRCQPPLSNVLYHKLQLHIVYIQLCNHILLWLFDLNRFVNATISGNVGSSWCAFILDCNQQTQILFAFINHARGNQ